MKFRDELAKKVKIINESIYEVYSREVLKWCEQNMPRKLEKLFIGARDDEYSKLNIDTLNMEIDCQVKLKVFDDSNFNRDYLIAYFNSEVRPKASDIVVSWLIEEGFDLNGTTAYFLHIKM